MEPGGEREPVTICGYESRYDQILETALNEYADVPGSDYYRDGYNLVPKDEGIPGGPSVIPA
ncbi:MAG: hypothetical protein ACLR0U_04580 [Enterocloster clostridioformis]